MKNKISTQEIEIMDYILCNEIKIVTPSQLYEYFNDIGDQWKLSAIYSNLRKLKDRHFLELQKDGRNNYYVPKISRKEFADICSIQTPGSVDDVPIIYCSLTDDLLSNEDVKRIRKIIAKLPND